MLEEEAGGGEGLLAPVGASDGVGDIGPRDSDRVDDKVEVAAALAPVKAVAGCAADPAPDDVVWEEALALEESIVLMGRADSM